MQLDELHQGLLAARDGLPPAHPGEQRAAVARRVRRRRGERAGVVAAVIGLVATLGWVGVIERRSEPAPLHGVPATPPLLLPTDLPPGTALGAITVVEPGAGVVQEVAWTSSRSDHPEGDDAVITLVARPRPADEPADQPPWVGGQEDRWRQAWVASGFDHLLATKGLDRAAATAVRDSVWGAASGALDATVPDGFREVHRSVRPEAADQALLPEGRTPGYLVHLTRRDQPAQGPWIQELINVSATPGSGIWMAGASEHTVPTGDVRGHPALWLSSPGDGIDDPARWAGGLMWWEQPGVLVVVVAATEADARRIAEGLRSVEPAEWEAQRAALGPRPPATPPTGPAGPPGGG